ncbi:preprotein translocase subunit SecY [Enterococcus dispar]|jgi:preprotein translocase subunit SecY|uniref:Protein translocase subunit SecY n=1 Tax=Enterococcus dispar ATCC 51266 TaxID=1139219 RepID=S1P187_9ENTE|nr:preprotein translocase subunit SecY [Enterococcus dispar]EOT38938.1 preprotein translocase, SecY subunit [Enterococcus dispar ATCC 51266]EOW86161.1 preprotein translocase, SecY subunit [Enterococcus dispar ATCC 51266]MCU7357080.1 preprotein translocase subunit SecY [Enterococcus dispar]MDT2705184.1 preprotein translocase subunit SecY [Enterococcus dispar]OJG39159.1 preprotein translocase, SecY subunit [Enterococcus dispar]
MFKLLKDSFKVKDIRSKIFFTVFALFVFRLGAHITVPGVDASRLQSIADLPFLNMLNMVSGSAMQNFSVFSMGVSPYITASIVIQLLQMDIVPKFVEWSKQGEVGRRKLNQATRILTLVLAFVQSVGITAGFNSWTQLGFVDNPDVMTFVVIGLILTAGTMFVTWLGEQITEKGVGNGVSMIIFAGIISRLPDAIKQLVEDYFINIESSEIWKSALFMLALVIAVLVIITLVTFVQQAERKIPIQYTKRVAGAPTSSYLPLKVNAAGVIPVIFASSFIATPNAILQALSGSYRGEGWYDVMMQIFNYNTVPGATIYTLLIVAFTFFYAFVQVNPEKLAENLQKQGSYIPSVRPGKGTEDYVSRLLMRLSAVGALFLGLVALLPIIAQMVWNLPQSIGLGGTSLLIVIGVALETAKQLEGLMLKRKYTGFIN